MIVAAVRGKWNRVGDSGFEVEPRIQSARGDKASIEIIGVWLGAWKY